MVNNALSTVVPAKAGTHTPQRSCYVAQRMRATACSGLWVPAFAGTTAESQS